MPQPARTRPKPAVAPSYADRREERHTSVASRRFKSAAEAQALAELRADRRAAYEALALVCAKVGWPTSFRRDLTTHAQTALLQGEVPLTYGASLRETGLDLYTPGSLESFEWLEGNTHGAHRYYIHVNRRGVREVSREVLLGWLADALDLAAFRREAIEWEERSLEVAEEARRLGWTSASRARSAEVSRDAHRANQRIVRVRVAKERYGSSREA